MLQTQAITADMSAQIHALLARAGTNLAVDTVRVYAFEPELHELIQWSSYGRGNDAAVGLHILNVQGKLIQNIPVVGNSETDFLGANTDVRSFLYVALTVRNKPWGCIAYLDHATVRTWSMGELTAALEHTRELEPLIEREHDFRIMQQYSADYQLIADYISDVIVRMDEQGCIVSCGGYLIERGLLRTEDIVGKSYEDFLCSESGAKVRMPVSIEEFMRRRRSEDVCVRLTNGEIRWIRLKGYPIREGGTVRGMLCVLTDMHAMVMTQKALRESEAKYKLLADNISDVVWVLDLATLQYTYISPSDQRARGYTLEEALAQSPEECTTPECFQYLMRVLEEEWTLERSGTAENRRSRSLEMVDIRKDGTTFRTHMTISAIRNEEGQPVALIGASRNIEDLKRIEDQLRASEAKYRILAESLSDVLVIADRSGRITYVSPAISKFLGYTPEEIMGRWPTIQVLEGIVTEESWQVLQNHGLEIREEAQDMGEQGLDLGFRRKDGSVAWGWVTYTVLNADRNCGVGDAIALVRDTTRARLIEDMRRLIERQYPVNPGGFGTVFRMDFEGTIITMDENTRPMFGFAGGADEPLRLSAILGAKHYERLMKEIAIVERTMGIGKGIELHLKRTRKVVLVPALYYQDAAPVGILCVARGIHTGYVLGADDRRMEEIARHSRELTWITDERLRTIYVSPSVMPLLGYEPGEAMGMELGTTYPPAVLERIVKAFELGLQAMDAGEPWQAELPIHQLHKDGSRRSGSLFIKLMYDTKHKYNGFVGITHFTGRG